jgi:lysophospholipase L1-like esterase
MKKLLLSTVAFFVSLAGVELVLNTSYFLYGERYGIYRYTHNISETGLFRLTGDMDLPYVARPNVSLKTWSGALRTTNEHGYLGDPLTDEKNLNVLVVGDSVAWGMGVQSNETFAERLREMARETHPNIKVGNIAEPGYNTLHEVTLLRQVVSGRSGQYHYKPDLVIFQYNPNDSQQIGRTEHKNNIYNFYLRKPTKTFGDPSRLYRYLLEHSELFFRLNDLLQASSQGNATLYDFPDWYQDNYRKLVEVKQLGDEFGFECLFLNFGYSNNSGNYDELSSFNTIFKHSVDLRKEMEQAEKQPIWFDPLHPNAAGHTLIARRIYEYLTQHDLLKATQRSPANRDLE